MELIFQSTPEVQFGGSTFRNCRVILQYEDIPLLEIIEAAPAGYTSRFTVFHNDGTKIGTVNGSRIHLDPEGAKARLDKREEDKLIVVELEGKPILELRRDKAHALKGWAELYAPTGVLVKAFDSGVSSWLRQAGNVLQIGQLTVQGMIADGCEIGIHVRRDGIAVGVGGGSVSSGKMIIGGGPQPNSLPSLPTGPHSPPANSPQEQARRKFLRGN